MDANKIQVIDAEGNEIEFEVLFTFDNEDNGKKYVLYYDPEQEESNVFASVYDDDGKLYEIEDPKEWEMIEEVFQSFMAQEENEEEHQCCGGHGHDHDHECCGGHNHEGHECCGEHDKNQDATEKKAGCDCEN